ncbi:hypothetical protein EV360DRAFT_66331 [Lentinula raphanica]|nr:hypothetical protein EV360DRAFT_66331 [Lentinula raphanica]
MRIRSPFSSTRFKAVHVIGLLIFISLLADVQALPIDSSAPSDESQLASQRPAKRRKTVHWSDPLTTAREFNSDNHKLTSVTATQSSSPAKSAETINHQAQLESKAVKFESEKNDHKLTSTGEFSVSPSKSAKPINEGSKAVDSHYEVHFQLTGVVGTLPLSTLRRLVAEEKDPDVYKSLPAKPKAFQYIDFSKASAKRFLKIAGKPLGWKMDLIDKCMWVNHPYCPTIDCHIKFEVKGQRMEDQSIEGWMDVSGVNGEMYMPADFDQPGFSIKIEDGEVVGLQRLPRINQPRLSPCNLQLVTGFGRTWACHVPGDNITP